MVAVPPHHSFDFESLVFNMTLDETLVVVHQALPFNVDGVTRDTRSHAILHNLYQTT